MRLATIILLMLVPIFLCTNTIHAQIKVIEIDSISGAPKESLPFDQAFILKIPTKSSRVRSVTFARHIGHRSLAESFEYRLETARSENRKPSIQDLELVRLDTSDYHIQSFDKKKYLMISIRDTNLLDPGNIYTFYWAEDTSDPVMQLFDSFDKYKASGPSNTQAQKEAQKIYTTLANENFKKFGFEIGLPLSDTVSLKAIENAYNKRDSLFKKYSQLREREANYNRRVSNAILSISASTRASLHSLMQVIAEKSPDFDTKLKTVYLPDIRKATQRIIKLNDLDSSTYHRLLKGIEPLDCNPCQPTSINQYESRLNNLKSTLASVDELYIVAEALLANKPTLQPAVDSLKAFKNTVQSFLKNEQLQDMEGLVKMRKAIKDVIFNMALSGLTYLGGSTHTYSFETRNKLSIAPDFGIVTTRINANDKGNPYGFVPYLGFHVNLRPINRDIPFWSYRHRFFHYTSLFVGWSLVSIDNGPKQSAGADSVSSFFSKGKGTLLTGLGIRLGNAVKLTGGAMWYFKYYPSATIANFYDSRRLNAWFFVGLSIDLALKDLLNGISDVFSGAPRSFQPPSPSVTPN